jgi:pyruvate-formate lyase-activating enzyme
MGAVLKTYNDNPNFSILLPGGCNAHCSFCFNDSTDISNEEIPLVEYVKQLKYTLENMPENFRQISLTGGEPLISPYFSHVISMLALYGEQFRKVVLTTNGTHLINQLPLLSSVVNHINISRHHYDDAFNKQVFKGTYTVDTHDLHRIIDQCGQHGIDVSLNCVIKEHTMGAFIERYIKYARELGVRSVNFRRESGTLEPTSVENGYEHYKVISESSCPVCRTKEQLIRGVTVIWSGSLDEPSEHINDVYELIFMPDGNLYRDWKGMKPYVVAPKEVIVDNHSGYFELQNTGYADCERGRGECGRIEAPSCNSSGCG